MLKKLTNKKGFTLMEMLIVVAIIAVLVAIAIPTFNDQLEKSRQATDVANIRAAYAEASVKYLSGDGATAGKAETPTLKSEDFSALDANLTIGTKKLSEIKDEAGATKGQQIIVTVNGPTATYAKKS